MTTKYEQDVAAWANEQASRLRAGELSQLDTENLATEIESVGFWFEYELNERCGILLAQLARWHVLKDHRTEFAQRGIELQREKTNNMLKSVPSLRHLVDDEDFLEDAWLEALVRTTGDLGCFALPDECPWPLEQALREGFLP